LIDAEITAAGDQDAPHVDGWISHDGNVIEVLNVTALTAPFEDTPAAERLANLVEASS
jgi:hypothetical protein